MSIKKLLFSCIFPIFGFFGFYKNNSNNVLKAERLYNFGEILKPFWEGDTSYNETVTVIEEQDGTIKPINLIYKIKTIISVKNAELTKIYTEGIDYDVDDGQLIINKSGSIPVISYNEFHPKTGSNGFESVSGGYVCWNEGSWYHCRQIVITYTHEAGYQGYIPEAKGNLLPNFISKLQNKSDIKLFVYGDSISEGGNSSGSPLISVLPYMPIYPNLFAQGLRDNYGVNVTVINESVGGTASGWGVSHLTELSHTYKNEQFDLAIVAFGMNDMEKEASSVASNVQRIVSNLKSLFGCESIVISTLLPNPDAVHFNLNQKFHADEFLKNEKEGAPVLNLSKVHKSLLEVKKYADLTGNNINHANDFLARIYAMSLLETIKIPEKKEEIPNEHNHVKGCSGSIASSSILILSCSLGFCLLIDVKRSREKKYEKN